MAGINSGFGAVQEALEKSANKGFSGNYLPILQWKDDRNDKGELYQHAVRFISDAVVPVQVYEFIPCKDGKLRDFVIPDSIVSDPKDKTGVDVIKELGIKVPQYGNKNNLIDPKARDLVYGVVVVREEKSEMVNGRRVLTYVDKMEEVEYEKKNGEKVKETRPMYRLVKQSVRNFWDTFISLHGRYGTITDRDYVIERRRNDKDTSYTIIPAEPIEGLRDPDEVANKYKDVPTTAEDIVKDLASEERARKLLGDAQPESSDSESKGDAQSYEPAQKNSAPSNSSFDDFRKQLMDQE